MEKRFRHILKAAGLAPGDRLLLGVSGGLDSVVLLRLMSRLAPGLGLQVAVCHLDHQIRSESAADARFVDEQCRGLDIPCFVEVAEVPRIAQERKLSLETAAREVRRETLLRLARDGGCARILLAHHRDDQAETFLLRLLRGSGSSGLQAMRPLDGPFWRPLLNFARAEILAYAEEQGLAWREDRTNADPDFLRNRIRHQLLPELGSYNPQIAQRLTALAQQFQREESFWDEQVEAAWLRAERPSGDGLCFDVAVLASLHPALLLRLLRRALQQLRGKVQGVESAHLEALAGLVAGEKPQAELDLPGCWAARRYAELWLRVEVPSCTPFCHPLRPGERLALADGRVLLAELGSAAQGEGAQRVEFDAEVLEPGLEVRSLRPGDRFIPSGMQGRRKVKDYLIDQKLEQEARATLPILVGGGQILWLVGLRRSGLAKVTQETRKVLSVRLLDGGD